MEDIRKYPRTRHIEGSRQQHGDHDLKSAAFDEIKNKFLVLEEKIDGANCGISFSAGGKLMLQSRGHYLTGGYQERQFDLLKTWAGCHQTALYQLLGNRYIMYGEWMYAKHTIYYDALPHYFMEFDIFDKAEQIFLSTACRREMLLPYPFICSVRVLKTGKIQSPEELRAYLGASAFRTEKWREHLFEQCRRSGLDAELADNQTDGAEQMEGIYIKEESDKAVLNRYKFVRASFLNAILNSETHWADRPILPNGLAEGTDLFAAGMEGG